MALAVFIAGLLALSAATRLPARPGNGACPSETVLSEAFNLVAKTADPARDLDPPVDNFVTHMVHVMGAFKGIALMSPSDLPGDATPTWPVPILWVNGTDDDLERGRATTNMDAPIYSYQLELTLYVRETLANLMLFIGAGDPGIRIAADGPYPHLTGPATRNGTYVACVGEYPFRPGEQYNVVRWAEHDGDPVPDECVPIYLVPQTAELQGIESEGAEYDHDNVRQVPTFLNVSEVDAA